MNQGWIYREQVDRSAHGLSVLDYYTQRYSHSTQAEWQARIIAGQILLDEQAVTASTPLRSGQWLTYQRPPWEEPPVPLDFALLYEDPDLMVIAKPAGLPVLPGGGFLVHTVLGQLQQRYPQETPFPIHRLGRGTSGLLLLARSPLARSALSQQMRQQQIHKRYRALIGPSDLPDRCTITQPIGKLQHPVLGYVYGASPTGKPAHSEVEVRQRRLESTLLDVTIRTGRPHQIRIHLATIGYPLLGDPLYQVGGIPRSIAAGPDEKVPVPGDCGYHLHAHELSFVHPRTAERITLIGPAPPELEVTSAADQAASSNPPID